MNERMVELYKEAAEFAYEMCKSEGRTGGASDHIWNTLSTGKFAQLILAECMTTILKESKWYWDKDEFESSNAIQNAARRLKEHFGVEE